MVMIEEVKLVRFEWALKGLLREKANFDIWEGFLTALFKKNIRVISLADEEDGAGEKGSTKAGRISLLVEAEGNQKMLVSLQIGSDAFYLEGLLRETARLILEKRRFGKQARTEPLGYAAISIIYGEVAEAGEDYFYYGQSNLRGFRQGDHLEQHLLPEYYLIQVEKFPDEILSGIDEWIYYLKHSNLRESFHSPYIGRLFEKLDLLKLTKSERKAYEKYLQKLAVSRELVQKAKDEGIQIGREQGLALGKATGEKQALQKTVVNLRQKELPIELIAEVTGFKEEEIYTLGKNGS